MCAGLKRVLRYLKGTENLGLKYDGSTNESLTVYSDADCAGDLDDRHSTSGNALIMASGAVSWLSKARRTREQLAELTASCGS